MDDFAAEAKKSIVRRQRWVGNWVCDDTGVKELLSYKAKIPRQEDISAVRDALLNLGIPFHTDPGNVLVVHQQDIPLFDQTFPGLADRSIGR